MSINTFRFLNHLSNFIKCKQHAIQVENGGQYKSDLLILMEEKYFVVLQWERSKTIKSHSNCPRCLSNLTFTRCCTIHGSYGVHNKWLLFMKYCFGHRGQGSKGCFIQGNKDCSRRSDTQSPLVFPPNDLNWSPPSEQCVYDPNTWNRLKDIRCAKLTVYVKPQLLPCSRMFVRDNGITQTVTLGCCGSILWTLPL